MVRWSEFFLTTFEFQFDKNLAPDTTLNMVGVRMISPGHIKRNEKRLNEDFHLEKMAFQLPKSGLTPSTSASGLDPSLSGQWLLWLAGKMELLTRMTLLLKNQNHSKHSTCTTADVGVHKS